MVGAAGRCAILLSYGRPRHCSVPPLLTLPDEPQQNRSQIWSTSCIALLDDNKRRSLMRFVPPLAVALACAASLAVVQAQDQKTTTTTTQTVKGAAEQAVSFTGCV